LDHRVKNLFALASGVVATSARSAATPDELASAVRDRLGALARACADTAGDLRGWQAHRTVDDTARLDPDDPLALRRANRHRTGRVAITGDMRLAGGLVTTFALLLHEFATNAAKYGALSTSAGHIEIACSEPDGQFVVTCE
jgi:two-component sensor histidine kinase